LIPAPLPTSITKDISKHDTIIRSNLENISKDLAPPNDHRYSRQVSPGLQEMVEALTFSYYLQHQRLATPAELQALLSEGVKLSNDDYLLGLCDLVGEMMRIAITCIATRGRLPGGASTESEDAREPHHVPRTILEDLREIRVFFEKLNVDGELGRDIGKKMDVLRTCVEKVETAAYGMIVRGRERPKGWVPDLSEDHKSTEGVEIF
jgi:predicted translin family RNA/ssDNA-binding protein